MKRKIIITIALVIAARLLCQSAVGSHVAVSIITSGDASAVAGMVGLLAILVLSLDKLLETIDE